MHGARLAWRGDIVILDFDHQKGDMLHGFQIDAFASEMKCTLTKQALMKHAFGVPEGELGVEIDDGCVEIQKWIPSASRQILNGLRRGAIGSHAKCVGPLDFEQVGEPIEQIGNVSIMHGHAI